MQQEIRVHMSLYGRSLQKCQRQKAKAQQPLKHDPEVLLFGRSTDRLVCVLPVLLGYRKELVTMNAFRQWD